MTYSTGGLIQATDLNGFVSTGTPNVNAIWSTGSGNSGYGQTALATVSTGDLITAAPWSALTSTISNIATHTGTSISSMSPLAATGGTVSVISNIATNISAINTGRLNLASSGTDIVGTGSRTTNWGGGVSVPLVTATITVTFGSDNQARYFFNAGGSLRTSWSITGSSLTAQAIAWNTISTDIGTMILPADSVSQSLAGQTTSGQTRTGPGTVGVVSTYIRSGFYQLTSTLQEWYREGLGSVYTADNIRYSYSYNGTGVVIIKLSFNDATSGGTADIVNGTLTVNGVVRPPSTTNITNTWGTPTVGVVMGTS